MHLKEKCFGNEQRYKGRIRIKYIEIFDISDENASIRKNKKIIDFLARSPTFGPSPGPKDQIWANKKNTPEYNTKTKK